MKVILLLQAKGLKVVAVQNLLTSLSEDVVAAQRVIDAQTANVILVRHSRGGAVITQSGSSAKVKALVHVVALVPDEGQASADLGKDYPSTAGIQTAKPDKALFLYLPPDLTAKNVAQDLPRAATSIMASMQGPIPTAPHALARKGSSVARRATDIPAFRKALLQHRTLPFR